jgi:hypothetical protein
MSEVEPLHGAVHLNNFEVVKSLFPYRDARHDMCFLEKTVIQLDDSMFKLLLSLGVNIDIVSSRGRSVCFEMVCNGHLTALKRLVEAGAKLNVSGVMSCLYPALHHNNTEIIKYLIDSGIDVNSFNMGHDTPLMCAKDLVTTKLLISAGATLELGADINNLSLAGRSICYHMSALGRLEDLKYAVKCGGRLDSETVLFLPEDHLIEPRWDERLLEILEFLLDNGLSLKDQPSILDIVVSRSIPKVSELLISRGAIITEETLKATLKSNCDQLKLLLSHYPKPSPEFIKSVISGGHVEYLQLMIRMGFFIAPRTSLSSFVFFDNLNITKESLDMLVFLLEEGITFDLATEIEPNPFTPLNQDFITIYDKGSEFYRNSKLDRISEMIRLLTFKLPKVIAELIVEYLEFSQRRKQLRP